MKSSVKVTLGTALVAALPWFIPAHAQENAHGGHHVQTEAAAEMSEGEIRKVNKETGKLTIRHGELKNLDMPPMTMVFQVKDPVMLDQVKPGDKIRFVADKLEGKFTVMEIEVLN